MSPEFVREYVELLRRRYIVASRTEKKAMLDEFCQITGYNRKSAIRVVNRRPGQQHQARARGRPRAYGSEVISPLRTAWRASGYVCSKRLAPFMDELLTKLVKHGAISLSSPVREQLVRMSPATIDRLLHPYRLRPLRRPYAGNRSVASLRDKIAVKSYADLRGLPAGYLEMDLVLHCGMTTEGFYLTTLVAVDTKTCWTECQCAWGQGAKPCGERNRARPPSASLSSAGCPHRQRQ